MNDLLESGTFAISPLILSGFMRSVTHPSPIGSALSFVKTLSQAENSVELHLSPEHWPIFTGLVRAVQAKGDFIPDCYLAALAIEHGCTFVTTDRNFSRFKKLKLQFLENQ